MGKGATTKKKNAETKKTSHDEWRAKVGKMLSDKKVDPDFLKQPNLATKSAQRFFHDLETTHGVIGLLGTLVSFAGAIGPLFQKIAEFFRKLRQKIERAKIDRGEQISISDDLSSEMPDPSPVLIAFDRQSPIILQMVLVRTADNFSSYLSDIIRECIQAEPNLLNSDKTLTYTDILKHATLEELRENMVERTMSAVTYSGFEALSKWFDERLGISELRDNLAWRTLNELVELRNCIVHNSCRTSAKYLRAIGCEENKDTLNKQIEVTLDFGFLAYCAAAECVAALDRVIAEKFKLDRKPLNAGNNDLFKFSYQFSQSPKIEV